MPLNAYLGADGVGTLRAQLAKSPFRRLSNTPENTIDDRWLCQAIHVDRLSGSPRLLISDADRQDGYYAHSVETAKQMRDELLEYGIRRLFIGPLAMPGGNDGYAERVHRFAELVAGLREAFGPDFEMMVDPAGLCMRQDLRWGVRDSGGGIDVEETLAMVSKAAVEFSEAGADAMVAIGRVNCEVSVIKAAASKCARPLRVMSFSTNSETTSAYFETTRHDVTSSRTGQKVLVGNGNEMMLRAISDFGEGSDVIVQKPVEAFHLLEKLKLLASGQLPVNTFVENTAGVPELLRANPLLVPAFERGAAALTAGERTLKTGTYEVSGTYSMVRMLSRAYSEELAWSMMDEILMNAASAAGGTMDVMISRNALWYAKMRREIMGRLDRLSLVNVA